MCHAPTSRYRTGISLRIQTDCHLLIAFLQPLFRVTSWDAYTCGFSTIGYANSGPHAKLLKYVLFFFFIIYTSDIPFFKKFFSNRGACYSISKSIPYRAAREKLKAATGVGSRYLYMAFMYHLFPSYTTFPLRIPLSPFIYYFHPSYYHLRPS